MTPLPIQFWMYEMGGGCVKWPCSPDMIGVSTVWPSPNWKCLVDDATFFAKMPKLFFSHTCTTVAPNVFRGAMRDAYERRRNQRQHSFELCVPNDAESSNKSQVLQENVKSRSQSDHTICRGLRVTEVNQSP